jgi:hypothetical protein
MRPLGTRPLAQSPAAWCPHPGPPAWSWSRSRREVRGFSLNNAYRHARQLPGIHVFIVGKQTKTWMARGNPGHDGPFMLAVGLAAFKRAFTP